MTWSGSCEQASSARGGSPLASPEASIWSADLLHELVKEVRHAHKQSEGYTCPHLVYTAAAKRQRPRPHERGRTAVSLQLARCGISGQDALVAASRSSPRLPDCPAHSQTPGCQHALAGELAGRQTESYSIESCGVVQQTLHKRLQHRVFVHLTPGSKAHATLVQVAKTTFCCERYEGVTSTIGSLLQLLAIPGMHSFQASALA